MNSSLAFLTQIKDNLEYADFDLIKRSIADLNDKFAPIATIFKGEYIDRVRINKNGEIFNKIDQITYITDATTLDNCTEFGRANFPKQSVFYGAIPSPQAKYPRATAYIETTKVFEDHPLPDCINEIFTLGRWKVLEDIHILEMIFSDEALKISEYARTAFNIKISEIQNHHNKQHFIDQGKLFSEEFARSDCRNADYNYKISSAYSNYVWNATPLKGITYPSVKTEYQGQNVALLPELVDKKLELEIVVMFKFERENGINKPIDSFRMAKDLGANKSDFQWFDYHGKDYLIDATV